VIVINGISGGMSFTPSSASLRVGDSVAWRNADAIAHAIAQNGGGLQTPVIGPGATSQAIQITTLGNLPYHCSIHPSMTGTLVAGP
jgi:plastocyanin